MKRVLFIAALSAALLLGAAALIPEQGSDPAAETMAALPAASPRERGFVLGEYGGRVAVYAAGEDAGPGEITAIRVRFLPAADREGLRKGIPARDETALAMLLEDLGS